MMNIISLRTVIKFKRFVRSFPSCSLPNVVSARVSFALRRNSTINVNKLRWFFFWCKQNQIVWTYQSFMSEKANKISRSSTFFLWLLILTRQLEIFQLTYWLKIEMLRLSRVLYKGLLVSLVWFPWSYASCRPNLLKWFFSPLYMLVLFHFKIINATLVLRSHGSIIDISTSPFQNEFGSIIFCGSK